MEIDKSKLAFTLSHSSLDLLDKCPYSWYEKYIQKFYPEVEDNTASEFGGLFHEVAENYTGTGIEEVYALIKKFRYKYVFNQEYEDKIPKAINSFLYFYNTHLKNAKKVYREKKITILLNEFLALTGSLDVLYQNDNNEWTIVDYKSSKKISDCSAQLSCYFYLLTAISGKAPDKINCQVVYLVAGNSEQDTVQNYIIDSDDRQTFENKLWSAVTKISQLGVENVGVWKKKPGPLCPWCMYYKSDTCDGNRCLKIEHK
jgi:hypothetical protein